MKAMNRTPTPLHAVHRRFVACLIRGNHISSYDKSSSVCYSKRNLDSFRCLSLVCRILPLCAWVYMECVIRKSSQLITLSRSNYSVNLRDTSRCVNEEIIIEREKRLLFTNWRPTRKRYIFICLFCYSIPFPFFDTHSLRPITVIIGLRHPATNPLPVICVILPKINPPMYSVYTHHPHSEHNVLNVRKWKI